MDPKTCAFCEIVSGLRPAHIVFEGPLSLAFLDKRPLFPGHVLLVPKAHFMTIQDLPQDMVEPLFLAASMLASAVEKAMAAEGIFMAINNKVSQSVPHLHIHIVPRKRKDGLKGFFWPRHHYQDEQHILKVQKTIMKAVQQLGNGNPAINPNME